MDEEQPLLNHSTASSMRRRFEDQQRQANWSACQFSKTFDDIIKRSWLPLWILLSNYLPGMFGEERDPTCQQVLDVRWWNNIYAVILVSLNVLLAAYMITVLMAH